MGRAYIVCGSPGAGKTVYGKKLAERLGAAFLDIDVSTEGLVRLALELAGRDPADRDSTFFKEHFREPIYEQLFDIACDNLRHIDVVIAGPFTRELRNPDWCERLAVRLGAPVEIHYISCPPEIRMKRMRRRGNDRDEAKLRNWKKYVRYYDETPPLCPHVLVDNSEDSEGDPDV
ncbi:ATP-binding protein [Geobacter sp. DSM 9736]|uniref:AAA family ATPase n=1 Tax=Geobacter sp. DSM 9736 TaxID=1277350 RepID=UPI000B5089F6|nr:ATP-binding protein [Geobacter sp. DSM 9736]SNB44944.1 Dephospho-CoA kinase [Geobacter sp. DSM 9736]